jgi:hypothetical protein
MTLTSEQQSGIYDLADKSSTARAIFRNFRERERDRSQHTAERLLQIALENVAEDAENPPTYKDVIEFIKDLDRLELGFYRVGRKGCKTRVEWIEGVVLRDVGQAGLLLHEDIDQEMAKAGLEPPSGSSSKPGIGHTYRLRPDFEAHLYVPDDITPVEARRLSAWAGSLSME